MVQTSLKLGTMMQSFINCLESEGKSPKTTEFYTTALRRFDAYLGTSGLERGIHTISISHARDFLHYLQHEARRWETKYLCDQGPLTLHSVHAHGRAIKAFWSWLVAEGILDGNALSRLKLPRLPQIVLENFSPTDIRALLGTCAKSKEHGYRNALIVILFLDTGLRLSELVNLRIDDIEFETSSLRVIGKGRKERVVPFGSQTRRQLRRYLVSRRPTPESPLVHHVFLTTDGYPLKPRAVQSLIRRLGNEARVTTVRCSPHTFRHTFATQYLTNGGDIFSLQAILGHSSLEVVKRYLRLTSVDVTDRYRRYSPVDRTAYGRIGKD